MGGEVLKRRVKKLFLQGDPPSLPPDVDIESDEFREIGHFHGKQWRQLGFDDFHERMFVFISLPCSMLPYYLGSAMYLSLQDEMFESDALLMLLDEPQVSRQKRTPPSVSAFILKKCLTKDQLSCFVSYLNFVKEKLPQEWHGRINETAKRLSL